MKVFNFHTQIKENHLDGFGHVNNAIYLQFFEEARWEMITQGGYSWTDVQREAKKIVPETFEKKSKQSELQREC